MRNIYALRALFHVEDNKYLIYLLENFILRKNHFQQQIFDRRIDDGLYEMVFIGCFFLKVLCSKNDSIIKLSNICGI